MNSLEKEYYEKCKRLKPFESGDSLHVSSEYYYVEDKVVELYYIIGENEPCDINIYDKEGYKTPSQQLNEILNLVGKKNDDEIVDLLQILKTAVDVFDNDLQKMINWLTVSNQALHNEKPINMLNTAQNMKSVKSVMCRLKKVS